ncbi:COMM domain-containing protein 10 [Manacus vitellinus]|uniref:COMM domain-containing protein 10 n=1 Tax=Manacus vitellinus TaxID=328815 RepID=UPI00115CDFCB|nr:COMM domain-containing protein 10 [Manacus vitellinus]
MACDREALWASYLGTGDLGKTAAVGSTDSVIGRVAACYDKKRIVMTGVLGLSVRSHTETKRPCGPFQLWSSCRAMREVQPGPGHGQPGTGREDRASSCRSGAEALGPARAAVGGGPAPQSWRRPWCRGRATRYWRLRLPRAALFPGRADRRGAQGRAAADSRLGCCGRGSGQVPLLTAPLSFRPQHSRRAAVAASTPWTPADSRRLLSRLAPEVHLKAESTFSEEEEEKLQIAFSLEKQDLHLVLETISFILEQAVYHNLKPVSLQQQLQSIHLDQDKAEAFATAWAAAGQDTIEKFRQRVLTPQKLETIGWQLNLQMAESKQAKLKSPQAVLELGVSNEDSKNLKKVFVEFSHQELFEFYNKLETIQAQLDSLT